MCRKGWIRLRDQSPIPTTTQHHLSQKFYFFFETSVPKILNASKNRNKTATLLLQKCTGGETNHPAWTLLTRVGPPGGHKSRKQSHLKRADIIQTQRGICSGIMRLIYSILPDHTNPGPSQNSQALLSQQHFYSTV